MANINWEVVGHVTPKGEMRVSGFSLDGQELFNEPLDLGSMIESLCESVEATQDHRFSEEGVKQITALAEVFRSAWVDVRHRLTVSEQLATVVASNSEPGKSLNGTSGRQLTSFRLPDPIRSSGCEKPTPLRDNGGAGRRVDVTVLEMTLSRKVVVD